MDAVIQGFSLVLDPFNVLLIFVAVLIGVCVGALPGLSSPMAIALLLPFSLSLEPISAIAMMAALYCAGTFGGSITAILINAPGAPPAVATAFDGYPMAKNGEAGRALGLAAVSSVVGGIFSLVIFLFMMVRWSWPRFRFDQLMSLAWKVMLPLGVLNLVAVAVVTELQHTGMPAGGPSRLVVCLTGWIVMLIGWLIVATCRPLVTDNRPRTNLGRYEVDAQI